MPATNELLQEGRYRISQSSTHNGDEKVFEAYDTVRNTNVIVREIPVKLNKVTTLSQQESLKLAFANQAKALTEIEHESLLHVHDYFSEIDRQYLVMEAVEGESLGELLDKHKKPFPVSQVTDWADELLDALNYLHTRKPSIIHRNVNPLNLKFDPSGKVKLLGVGLGGGPDSEFATMSRTENLNYSPMEQIWPGLDTASQKVITNSYDDRSERILKEPLDARSDIYSLGATLYFLITGQQPVDPIERSIEILEGKLDPLREPAKVASEIPSEISDVLMKALEIKRENRYDSALIMRQVLKTAIARVQEREEEGTREQQVAIEEKRREVEVEQKRSEAEAEQRRLEAEAEQKRLEAEAEERRLEAEAEQRRFAEAEQKRLEEEAKQKRFDAEAEEKRLEAEAQLKRLEAEADAKRLEAEAEQQRQNEQMQRQLREAEEQRLAAEQAGAAERLVREEEEETAKLEAAHASVPDENLLEIPVAAEVVAYRSTTDVEEDELASVLRELEESEAETNTPAEDVFVFDRAVDSSPQVSESDAEFDDMFTVPEKTGSSLPMPVIAGAAGLVVVIAIGAWFAMSGSSETPKPEPPQPVQVSQPAPVESNPATDAIVSTQSEPETVSSTTETQSVQPGTAVKTAAAAKPKKADAKAGPAKKKVTVDDLINDN